MPMAPLRPCRTCGTVGCHQHVKKAWAPSRPVPRIRGSKLQHLRDRLFTRQPLCVLCLAKGRTTLATIRDHIVNLQAGGTDTDDNTQAVCADCHAAKTQREALNGRGGSVC